VVVPLPENSPAIAEADSLEPDILSKKETVELVRAYYRLNERPRRRLLELARSLDPGERRGNDSDAA